MNKLEKIRENQHPYFKAGFDTAIALDLPVKFAEWANENRWYSFEDGIWKQTAQHGSIGKTPSKTSEELYKYWIDNIYSPD